MRRKIRDRIVLALLSMLLLTSGRAQDSAEPEHANPQGAAAAQQPLHRAREQDFLLNIASDQKSFWTSPKQLRLEDAHWLLPLGAFSAGLIASDTSIEKRLPKSPTLIRHSQTLSNLGVAALAGTAGTFYFWGRMTQNDHARETGLLSTEALADVMMDTSLLQFATGRERPLAGNGKGEFWHGGESFPSDHAAAAWSIASVVAHEYPGPLTQLLAYGTASAVTATRVVGREHFTSDAVAGSALGWWMGRQVYRAHHDPELDGADWGTFVRDRKPTRTQDMGSPYVPLDSWLYPAFDRLAALGYVQTGFAGLRPWTRMECARLVREGGELIEQQDRAKGEAFELYRALAKELAPEMARWEGADNRGAEVESIYSRFTGISGTPLDDGYHFGQTIINDFGRPYGEGANAITGFSSRAEAGPLAFYFRGEYQHAAVPPAVAPNVQAAIAANDQIPLVPAAAPTPTNRFQLLDSYLSFGFRGFQISAGRQSLWWGPGQGGAMLWSDDAEPVAMVRISRDTPIKLPSIFSLLGPMRSEFFFGKLEGHHFPPRPFIHGQKLSFKPTPNLELGFSRTVTFAGLPQPLTWGTFFTSFTSFSSGNPDPVLKPGARLGGVDWSYHIPGLRRWLIFYNDSIIHDDPSPLADPRRAAMSPGIYLPQIPGLPKLDFRIEAVYTDTPGGPSLHGDFVYWEFVYRDFYTNNGSLLGNWIGREGKGIQAWSTYWLSPRSTLQLSYRNGHVAKDFLEGGDYQDFAARADILVRPNVSLTGSLQYELWNFPLLSPVQNSNLTASFQLTYRPHWKLHKTPA